ncbi:hypothetical protein D6825_02025 [Candidatus Woesearchaeota archaeon]|nr:MAG: hypothetical protein D6825_02025 [Candidatus Woesearchaeota archaeon]
MGFNLIVEYGDAGYFSARQEIAEIIRTLGDDKAEVELLCPGHLGVKTKLNPRAIIEEIVDQYVRNPESISAMKKIIPVDNWCKTDISQIRSIIREDIKYMLSEKDKYNLSINTHTDSVNAEDLEREIRSIIKAEESDMPEKILRIDAFDNGVAITLMRPKDLFSR